VHRSEEAELLTCLACGSEILPEADRVYAFGDDAALCFDCAVARGGAYDELHDRWAPAPDVGGLFQPEGPPS